MTQSLFDIERIKAAYWVVLFLGVIAGILVTRLYDWFMKRGPHFTVREGWYRCNHCRSVYRLDGGRWSSPVFDGDNLPVPHSRMRMYDDYDFRYIYGDCYNHLKHMKERGVSL